MSLTLLLPVYKNRDHKDITSQALLIFGILTKKRLLLIGIQQITFKLIFVRIIILKIIV